MPGSCARRVLVEGNLFENVVRGTASGINILGRDDIHPSEQTKRITKNIAAHNAYGTV